MAQPIKDLPAMQETQETQVRSLSGEVPLEEGMVTHSSILAWRIPRTEELGRLRFTGLQRVGHDGSDLACMYAWTKTIAVSEETVLILSDW